VRTEPTPPPALRIEHLRKTFGALRATDDVSLTIERGELHAIIGPNGAGKSTLITQICGELRPDSGHIHLDGADVTGLPAHQRARLGLGRSFQITQLCGDFTVLENVLLSLEAKGGGSFDVFRDPRGNDANIGVAMHWLGSVGLADFATRRASALSHGERRQLEIAVALAREPRVLLLDEPMAGMGAEESARLAGLLAELKGRYSILLVEHDMDAVFALADRISVLVYGRVVFTGTAAEVRENPEVKAAYLGDWEC
jgi:branched-chain amino acid transport system ATP-binding protein